MRKVLIYFQNDRPRHRQQKGWPPCGLPRTALTIRKGQRDHLHRVRRGSRGPSRSYVVAKVQVRLAFSHQALPAFPFFSLIISGLAISSAPFIRVLASFNLDHSCFRGTNPVSEIWFERYHALFCTMHPYTQAENCKSYCVSPDKLSVERQNFKVKVEIKRERVIVMLITYKSERIVRDNCSYDREIDLCP